MLKIQIRDILRTLGEPHLEEGVDALSVEQQRAFLHALKSYGAETLTWQRGLLQRKVPEGEFVPLASIATWGNVDDQKKGEALLAAGKVGCILLAGGQGTRLGCSGPKGTFVVTRDGQSLFQLFCTRALHAQKRARASLPVAIMTSPLNHDATRAYLEQHQFFGLTDVALFAQNVLPLLDPQGHWMLQEPGILCIGPDGNGGAFELFYQHGLWHAWRKRGITHVTICVVDNPLGDPFDPHLVGFAALRDLDCAFKAVERLSSEEKMGVFATHQGRLKVLEYFEFSAPKEFAYAHTGLLCAKMSWIESLYAQRSLSMPYHLAQKTTRTIQGEMAAFKCERFLFDLLDMAPRAEAILYPRERTYAPLKYAHDYTQENSKLGFGLRRLSHAFFVLHSGRVLEH